MINAQSTRGSAVVNARVALVSVSVVATVLLLLSFLLGQLFVPAVGPMPAMTLDFGETRDLVVSGLISTTGFQDAYFNWLAWTIVLIAIVLTLLSSALLRKPVAIFACIVGILGLTTSVIGNKGSLTWSEFIDQLPNLRVGAYFNLIGFIVVIVAALLAARTSGGRRA